jgi:Holliday junction resolvase-like predicted endonuclease
VRSRSGWRFGSGLESVDARKVARLYRAVLALRRHGHPRIDFEMVGLSEWRVDVLALVRGSCGGWDVEHHVRGVTPP